MKSFLSCPLLSYCDVYCMHIVHFSNPGGSSLNNLIELKTININPTDTTVLLLSDCTEVGGLNPQNIVFHLASATKTMSFISLQYHRYIEIAIKQCRSSGIDCKIHGLNIVGRIRAEDEDLATVPFLASDNEEEEDEKTATGRYLIHSWMERFTGQSGPNHSEVILKPTKLCVTFLFFSLARKKSSGLESAATIRTKVFVWGLNDKDQLGGLKGSKVLLQMCF